MITNDKITEIFCIIDDFCKKFDGEIKKNPVMELPSADRARHRKRKGRMSESEIMTIIVCYHSGTFANFKHYYTFFIREHLRKDFPTAASWSSCPTCSS